MRVLITGGSGLIGRTLARALHASGAAPVILTREPDTLRRRPEYRAYEVVGGDPTVPGAWQERVDGCDAVVNLAGHNIFSKRWNPRVKALIRDSRVYSAQNLAAAVKRARSRPQVFIQGSAIGYYGPHGDEILDETAASGVDFLAVVCRELEEAAAPVAELGVRLVHARTGIVLEHGEGALGVMAPIFRIAPGAPIGSGGGLLATGGQYMSWIHITDEVGLLRLALDDARASGPMNLVAPHPVTNADFSRILTSLLRTRATPWRVFLPYGPPDALLKIALGEIANVLASGQRVVPRKALELGYRFQYPDLAAALGAIFTPQPKGAHSPSVQTPSHH